MSKPKRPQVGTQFRDYLNQRGENEIHEWLNQVNATVKMKINVFIQHLEGESDWRGLKWVKPLAGNGKGLWELRVEFDGVQYRPLFSRGSGSATLLLGALEVNDQFDPVGAIETALTRKASIEADNRRSIEHDFS